MQQKFTRKEIEALDQKFKLNLINSISGFKSANLIGTVNANGVTNLSIVSSVVHLGSDPALLGFIMRPGTVRRDTYDNIHFNQSYTINHVNSKIAEQSHYASAKFDAEVSEFDELNLTEKYIPNIPAPFVMESYLKIGMKFQEEILLSNGCFLIIGTVEYLEIENKAIESSGRLNLDLIDTVALAGLNKYYAPKHLFEFPYARVSELPDFSMCHKKARPDNVVFDQTEGYNAGLTKYATTLGAPAIEQTDLTTWKAIGTNKVNHMLSAKFERLKKDYEGLMESYKINEMIYNSKFDFEPIVGKVYHLYEKESGELFLSQIAPDQWNKKHIGSYEFDFDKMFVKIS